MKRSVLALISFIVVFSVIFCSIFSTQAADLMGDVNDDGKVNSADALAILQYSVGINIDIKNFYVGDVNGDMLLNSTDALIILQISVGLINPDDYTHTTSSWLTTTAKPITTTKKTTTTTTQEQTSAPNDIYNTLAIQRKFGFNKAYDTGSKFVNFYLSTIRVYFTYDEKDWLIELWKGEYAMAAVGCEVGYYYRDHNQTSLDTFGADYLLYGAVKDEDAMMTSMKLWQYVKSSDETPVQKIDYPARNCWWAADFETGVLEKHSDRTTLVMTATIDFPTTEMLALFTDELDKKGFEEGSIDSYHNVEKYFISDKTVTICWRYFDED